MEKLKRNEIACTAGLRHVNIDLILRLFFPERVRLGEKTFPEIFA